MPTGEIEFDSIERIFAQRDAKLAKKAANTIVRYQPKTQTIDGARAVGTSYLEYSPEDDEFTRSTSSHSRTASSGKKQKIIAIKKVANFRIIKAVRTPAPIHTQDQRVLPALNKVRSVQEMPTLKMRIIKQNVLQNLKMQNPLLLKRQ